MKREAGNAIEPVRNRRDCISGAVKRPILECVSQRILRRAGWRPLRRQSRTDAGCRLVGAPNQTLAELFGQTGEPLGGTAPPERFDIGE